MRLYLFSTKNELISILTDNKYLFPQNDSDIQIQELIPYRKWGKWGVS